MAEVQFSCGDDENVKRLEASAGRYAGLTAKQQKGIALLLSGGGPGEVARRVGVSRGTVYNWTHRNERFMAALESWQQDMARSARVRLLGMSGLAAKAITTALEKGDAKVALAMFKALGVMQPPPLQQEGRAESVTIVRRVVSRGRDRSGEGEEAR